VIRRADINAVDIADCRYGPTAEDHRKRGAGPGTRRPRRKTVL